MDSWSAITDKKPMHPATFWIGYVVLMALAWLVILGAWDSFEQERECKEKMGKTDEKNVCVIAYPQELTIPYRSVDVSLSGN